MTNACLGVLNEGKLVTAMNRTNIVLIPKKKDPKKVADYRPISLCNVVYKLVTKTIANRLKLVLPHLISLQQSAFVPVRSITDNVIVAFEQLHTLRKKSNGNKGLLALNPDMSKTYDRVKWPFVCKVMEWMGFPTFWKNMVYDCMFTAKFLYYVNGSVQGRVIPSRGLRQGFSLSSYLFLLCIQKHFHHSYKRRRRGRLLWKYGVLCIAHK